MAQNFPEMIMMALKDAVIKVFWKRDDMRSMLARASVPATLISAQDWTRYKFHIISPLLDTLNSAPTGLGPLRRVLQETLQFTNCDHLCWLSDGQLRKREGEEAVARLAKLVTEHDIDQQSKEEERQARARRAEEARRGRLFQEKLSEIRDTFLQMHSASDHHARGYGLEDLLYNLFLLFELNPKGAFRRTGEQIDGGFSLDDNHHFLLEAKWKAGQVDLNDLRDLDGAVGSSLDNTLGLFIAVNGFSEVGLDGYERGNRPKLICMDGQDLMAVLEGHIDLPHLLRRKLDVAAQKREVFAPVSLILQGKC